MELFYHPLSRYSQKVLLALYEKQANFYPRIIELSDPLSRQHFCNLYPSGKVPLLKHKKRGMIPESSIIIEYIDNEFPKQGTRLIPPRKSTSINTRLQDRLIDLELNNVLFQFENQQFNLDDINHIELKRLEKHIHHFLQYLDDILESNHWLCGDSLTLADCSLIPCLCYGQHHFQLFKYDNLSRYWDQAQLRGAYLQVKEEIEFASTEVLIGRRPIP
ncbi:glutathione S-transferase family protein [Shewanella sp. VB17]|uniref:glutathione S-transferase family protein n=1 Tax=Shewanella sp. VB17 TaxID=2739432 RepID=UPI0015648B84|nr:glutathione S-transferase family protein [Shewanella sp. VB17]NRD72142.1 glutathione S-transferase family protein [Shewanella sp. VB17]